MKPDLEKKLCNSIAQNGPGGDYVRVIRVSKKRLADSVAEEVRKHLATGRLRETLPGVRALSRSLGVSVPTVCESLHILAGEGLLEGGAQRRWRVRSGDAGVVPEKRVAPRPNRSDEMGRLLFLSDLPLSRERHGTVEVFAELADQLGGKGWEVLHRVENFTAARNARRSWDELLETARPDALVVSGGTPVIAKWAVDRKVRTLFLGGRSNRTDVPVVAVKVGTMFGDTLNHLTAKGHRRILLPLCGRNAELVRSCRKIATEAAVIVETNYASPQVLADLLRREWGRHAPDALVFLDWREFVAASAFLIGAGITIPRDVSVVVLSHNPSMEWHIPVTSHFEHPVKLMARMTAKWAGDGRGTGALRGFNELRAILVEGESVADRA